MKQTTAYKNFTIRIQEIFNFAVLVTTSVPVLKQNLKLVKDGVIDRLPDSDYFEPSVIYEITDKTIAQLRAKLLGDTELQSIKELLNKPLNNTDFKNKVVEKIGLANYKTHRNLLKKQSKVYLDNIHDCSANYQSKLATYLYFSTFSYFEAFIGDISNEVIRSLEKIDNSQFLQVFAFTEKNKKAVEKIDNSFDGRKIDRYKKYSKQIRGDGYQLPNNLIFSSTIDLLQSKIDNFKANEIPEILDKVFLFELTEIEKNNFHSIRDNRNSIGHGNVEFSPNLTDVVNANKFFKNLSCRIDKHINFYFFKPINYCD